jgi:hypothetical protein
MHKTFKKSKQGPASQLLLLMIAGFSLPAFAFQPLITDDTGTQGRGGNQFEFSLTEDRSQTAGASERSRSLPVVYTRGLSESIDLFAGASHEKISPAGAEGDASGGGNPSIGAKWRFFENEESGSSLAIKPEIVFPVSAGRERSGLGSGKISGRLSLIASQQLPFGAIHLNAGVGNERYRDDQGTPDATTTRFSLAPVWDVSEQLKLALDLGAQSARSAGTTLRSNFVELAAIYSPDKDLDFALGVIRSSDSDSPRTTSTAATAGVTWRFR